MSTDKKTLLKIGAGVAAVAAAGYFFFGPNGEKNRKHLRGWMIKMKGEIVERIEQAKDVSEAAYREIVDSVLAEYLATGKINVDELKSFADELKSEWKNIIKPQKALSSKGGNKKAKSASSSKR